MFGWCIIVWWISNIIIEKAQESRWRPFLHMNCNKDFRKLCFHLTIDILTIFWTYLWQSAIFVTEVATLSKPTLSFVKKDLAFPCSIELTSLIGISRPQFFHSMCKPAAVLIWAVPFGDVVFAELHLMVVRDRGSLSSLWTIARASLNGVVVIVFVALSGLEVGDVVLTRWSLWIDLIFFPVSLALWGFRKCQTLTVTHIFF
jgi:hypothetical protein